MPAAFYSCWVGQHFIDEACTLAWTKYRPPGEHWQPKWRFFYQHLVCCFRSDVKDAAQISASIEITESPAHALRCACRRFLKSDRQSSF